MAIQAIIVDDEELARSRLKYLLQAEPDIEVAAECQDGPKAVEAVLARKPDLLFLDVQMPEMDGFEVLKSIGEERRPTVIFVTAYDEYALRAFDTYALDYLLKPFNRARFRRALQRARLQIARETRDQVDHRLAALLKEVRAESKYLERLVIRSAGRVTFLRADDVEWFEGCANYARLHVGKESHMMREKISTLDAKLDPKKFVRIHRSSIARIDQIKELRSTGDGDQVVVLQDGVRLKLSRGYRERFRQALREDPSHS
jgi:two-component system, LytTR family, response regulator